MTRRRRVGAQAAFEADVVDLDDQGRAVGRVAGKVVFIDGALPGERVRARYTRRRGRYDEAVVEAVLVAHPQRVVPPCRHFEHCGGCVLQHLEHGAQLELKQARLLANLERLGGVRPLRLLEPLVGSPWGYRSRARLSVKHVPDKGGVLVGFRERNDHRIARMDSCMVLDRRVGEAIPALREALDGLQLRARVPQVEVALGEDEGALSFRHLDPLPDSDAARLTELCTGLDLQCHVQPQGPASIGPLAPARPEALHYRLPAFALRMEFGIGHFTQVNAAVNRAMVEQAMVLLQPCPGDRVLDLYCGIGNFTLPIARSGATVAGLEGSDAAVQQARHNASLNGLDTVHFASGDLDDVALCASWLGRGWSALLLDPPRAGAAALVEALARAPLPGRIVYVSCSPATLARDAAALCQTHGYRLAAAGIVDMFPHTNHVESMALFER